MGQLSGKVAMVTGSSRGIGKAISIALAQQGANLVLAARSIEGLKETQAKVMALGVAAEIVPTDVTSEEQIENLFKKAMARFGRLDILVNNAGLFVNEPIEVMSSATWDNMISVELRAPFLCTRAAFPIMKKQGGGRIINIGSLSASRVRPNTAPYNCAKFGLIGLTHTTSLEGRPYGIAASVIHPGITGDLAKNAAKASPEPMMSYETCASAVVFMATQPPGVNVLELVQLPINQPYLGRG
jgi:NAD(P)-dependent dehydrogenase (short-subunit alcohol dehydrogenase family)